MRKLTLLMVLFVSVVAFAQKAQLPQTQQVPMNLDKVDLPLANPTEADKNIQNIFWSENFAAGVLPSGWSIVDNNGMNFDWRCTNQVPGGQYSGTIPVIASTSGGYFMQLRGDFYNTPMPPTPVNMDAYFQTSAIDCSGKNDVLLSFQQYFRYCCSSANVHMSVWVSTDATNWTEFDVRNGTAVNAATANPMNFQVNISTVAANQPTVYLRWHMTGGSHYFWMVDDIKLSSLPVNDIRLNKKHFVFEGAGYYSKTPLSQLQDVYFGSKVLNFGTATQTNVNMNVTINDYVNEVYNQNGVALPTLQRDSIDTLGITTPFTLTNAIKTYHATMRVFADATDEEPGNNSDTLTFAVNDSVYARDRARTTTAGPGRYVGTADGDACGTSFYMFNPDEVTSISIYVTSNSSPGVTIIGKIWQDDGAGGWMEIIATDIHDVDSTELGTWITLPIIPDGTSEFLQAGTWYNVGVECYWSHVTSGKIYIGGDNTWPHDFPNSSTLRLSDTWYYDNVVPMIRLNVKTQAMALSASINSITHVKCNAGTTGAATALGTGGTAPYTYLWSNSATTASISGLPAGTYTVTITDNVGATATATAIITQPSAITTTANVNAGNIDITVTGGTPPYTYLWSTGSINQDITVSNAGTYTLTVTDINGCTKTHTEVITGASEININAINIYPNPTKGVINVTNAERANIYVYNIIGDVVSSVEDASNLVSIDISNLAEGSYIVKIVSNKRTITKRINLVK